MRHENGNAIVREVPILHIRHRHGNKAGEVGAVAQSFVGAKVKELIGHNFPPGSGTELIAFKRGFRRAFAEVDVVEIISSIEEVVAQEIVRGSMKFVGASLGDSVDLNGAAAVLGGVGIRLHLELLNFVDRGNSGDGIEVGRSIHSAI